MTDRPPPALALRDITVRYGAVVASRAVTLEVEAGTIHAVVGENGAGKSTLMKAVFGLAPLAAGEVWIGGEHVAHPSPQAAIRLGAGMVHQHFMLVDTLTVAENVVLGREPLRRGLGWPAWVDRGRAAAEVTEVARRHGLAVDPGRLVRDLSVGEQQRVEILKTLYRGARLLILDEPTAVLTPPEVDELFVVLRSLAAAGGTVVLVTHKLDEVMALSSRVTVLRRGAVVGSFATAETSPEALARAMVGRDLPARPPRAARAPGEVLLEARDLRTRRGTGTVELQGVSLAVRAGEIVGVAGVEGNGQTALVDALTGLEAIAGGTVAIGGAAVNALAPARRRALGLGHVPEDRQRRGLLLDRSVADNLLLGREASYVRFPWFPLWPLDRRRLLADTRRLLERFDVRPADPEAPARALSGGNQQKIVLARELEQQPRVLIAAQPTRGVDVGAIERIHAELEALRANGRAVLLVSADLDELLALADRIVVLYRGRLTAELPRGVASRYTLGGYMTGAAGGGSGEVGGRA